MKLLLADYLSKHENVQIIYDDDVAYVATMWRDPDGETTVLRTFYLKGCDTSILFPKSEDLQEFMNGLQEFAYGPRTTKS